MKRSRVTGVQKHQKMYQKRRQRHSGVWMVTLVVAIMFVGVNVSSSKLSAKLDTYHEKEAYLLMILVSHSTNLLNNSILRAEQEVRTQEIEEYGKYVQTDKFVEEIAKQKLGLVYEDEIVFKKEK